MALLSLTLRAQSPPPRLQSYLKHFVAKRSLQQSIVQKLASSTPIKQEELLSMVYRTMYKVLERSLEDLKEMGFDEKTPFPEDDNVKRDETLSLVYENCALFSDVYLRYPDITEALFRKITFREVVSQAVLFCHNRQDVFVDDSDNGKLLSLTMQELKLKPKLAGFVNPYRKTLQQPKAKERLQKERKKLPRGPSLSKEL